MHILSHKNIPRAAAGLFLLVCAALPSSAQVVTDGGAASEIRTLEHAWVDGQSRNDNRALDLIFDNALVYIEYGKVITKGEYLTRIRTASPQPQQIAMEALSVRTFGGTAIAVGVYREKGLKDGRPFLKRWRFVDTWVSKNGSWRLVAAASSPISK